MADEITTMLEHATVYLESARENEHHGPRRYPVAYYEARHSIEISGKVSLLQKTGRYFRPTTSQDPLRKKGSSQQTSRWSTSTGPSTTTPEDPTASTRSSQHRKSKKSSPSPQPFWTP